jgi:hypothetical protein
MDSKEGFGLNSAEMNVSFGFSGCCTSSGYEVSEMDCSAEKPDTREEWEKIIDNKFDSIVNGSMAPWWVEEFLENYFTELKEELRELMS